MPKTISLDEIRVQSTADEFISIVAGNDYMASISYEVYAPLAFDKNLNIHYSQDVENLDFNFGEVGAENIKIKLSIVNTIPLDFSIAAKAIDADGNVIEGIGMSLDDNINAGTLDTPVQSDITISMTSRRETIDFNGLRLDIKAVCPSEDMYGVALNKNSSLEIKDMILTCPEGVTVNM